MSTFLFHIAQPILIFNREKLQNWFEEVTLFDNFVNVRGGNEGNLGF